MTFPDLPFSPDQPWLAPLAGYTDLPFRLLCREVGAAAACTEMISAKGLVYQSSGTTRLVETCPEDSPLVVQLFGSDAGMLRQALDMLKDRGCRSFDLNAGCPVRKVVKTGAGAALLQDFKKLAGLVREMAGAAGEGRLGVKIRAGWDRSTASPAELARMLEASGAAWVTLHPRTARQGFTGRAEWSLLKEVKEQVSVPVLGSGDLFSASQAFRCLNQTGIDGVMFARGAMNNPGIFSQLRRLLRHTVEDTQENWREKGSGDSWGTLHQGEDPHGGPECNDQQALSDLAAIAQRHIELCRRHGHSPKAFLRMRTVLPRYLRGFSGAKALRSRIVDCRDWSELQDFVHGLSGLRGSCNHEVQTREKL